MLFPIRISCLFAALFILFSCTNEPGTISTGGPGSVAFRAIPFRISDIRLLEGPFQTALNVEMKFGDLEFNCVKPVRLVLQIRYPYRAKEGMEVEINGKPINRILEWLNWSS